LLEGRLCRLLQELLDLLLSEGLGSQELISSLERALDGDDAGAERSPLQIKLILLSLPRCSAKRRGKASL